MTQSCDLASFAIAASALDALDAAGSVEEVNRILKHVEATHAYARHTKNFQLEAEIEKIRLFAQVRLHELTAREQCETT